MICDEDHAHFCIMSVITRHVHLERVDQQIRNNRSTYKCSTGIPWQTERRSSEIIVIFFKMIIFLFSS